MHGEIWLSPPAAKVYHKLCLQLHVQTWNRWIISIDIDLVIVMPGQITSTYQLPPHIMTKARSSLPLILFFLIESLPLILIQFCSHW